MLAAIELPQNCVKTRQAGFTDCVRLIEHDRARCRQARAGETACCAAAGCSSAIDSATTVCFALLNQRKRLERIHAPFQPSRGGSAHRRDSALLSFLRRGAGGWLLFLTAFEGASNCSVILKLV
jgi:hypothetical protein